MSKGAFLQCGAELNVEEYKMNNKTSLHNPACAHRMIMAERELAAFIKAVTELYGAEQATLSTEIWLNELEIMKRLPGPASCDWLAITISSLARFASPMTDTKISRAPSPNCFAFAVLV
jgi:hypothetical protein